MRRSIKSFACYLLAGSILIGTGCSFIESQCLRNIHPVEIQEIIYSSNNNRENILKRGDKYALIINGSITERNLFKYLIKGVVNGLEDKISSQDEIVLIVFGNFEHNQNTRNTIKRNNKRVAENLKEFLTEANTNFKWRIDTKIVDYNNIMHLEENNLFSLSKDKYKTGAYILKYLLGDDINADVIYTGCHGFTRKNTFVIFADYYNPKTSKLEKEAWNIPFKEYLSWEENNNSKWLDLSCGSTMQEDKYSFRIEEVIEMYERLESRDSETIKTLRNLKKINTDNLVRVISHPNFKDYIKKGIEQKIQIKNKYFNHSFNSP